MDPISERLRDHYDSKFKIHGPTSSGVDWGANEQNLRLRYRKMLDVVLPNDDSFTLCDVGCGFGGLLNFAKERGLDLEYTGVDLSETMIQWATENQPDGSFYCEDFLESHFDRKFDYVICNGILTQKLATSNLDMDKFSRSLIRKMFDTCQKGIVFNVMSTYVNFHSENLYYKNPSELIAWCMSEISPRIRMDHSYPLYEYSIYLYRS